MEQLNIKRPLLQSETVKYYEARATNSAQDKGHVGASGPFCWF